MQLIDMTGEKFGRLTVLMVAERKAGKVYWQCQCDCGAKIALSSNAIRSGNTRSCGCLKKELDKKKHLRHGEKGTPLWRRWMAIKSRCNIPTDSAYHRYGAVGIKVCDEWDNYVTFRDWALSHGWDSALTIDRIDNDLGYSPTNCRFVTWREQRLNQKRMKV